MTKAGIAKREDKSGNDKVQRQKRKSAKAKANVSD